MSEIISFIIFFSLSNVVQLNQGLFPGRKTPDRLYCFKAQRMDLFKNGGCFFLLVSECPKHLKNHNNDLMTNWSSNRRPPVSHLTTPKQQWFPSNENNNSLSAYKFSTFIWTWDVLRNNSFLKTPRDEILFTCAREWLWIYQKYCVYLIISMVGQRTRKKAPFWKSTE